MRELKFRAYMVTNPNHSKAMRFYDLTRLVEMAKAIIANPSAPIMQYTGLEDKNGKEIYEGDIVKGWYGPNVVVWHDGACGFQPFCEYDADCDGMPDVKESSDCEIIGNIYENPELLDKELVPESFKG